MFQVTKWAGRNPALVRFIILPILFYVQCRMAFVLGAEMFFEGTTFSIPFLLAMLFINIGVCLVYPFNARELIHKYYYRLKAMQLVACLSAAALWGFIGNQTAAYFEHVRMAEHSIQPTMSYPFSVLAVTITSTTVGETESSMLSTKTVFKKYFKNAVAKIKKTFFTTSTADRSAKVLLMVLGILLLGIGVVVLVCGIECGGSSGAVALAVIGGLALLGLGIWALIGGFRRAFRMMKRPVVN